MLRPTAKSKERILTLLSVLVGATVLSFGMYNIHSQTNITEGGVLGLILLLNHWIGISPAFISPVLDILCYALGFRYLGKDFLKISILATTTFAGTFWIWEQFPPVIPNLSAHPLIAAILGALFVGIGVGLVVRAGGACGGDDALAMVISHVTKMKISSAYLFTDLVVLAASLSYIPLRHIAYSLVTVLISSFLIEAVQNFSPRGVKIRYRALRRKVFALPLFRKDTI